MNRSVFAPALTLLFCSAVVSPAFAQAKPAPRQDQAPATPPRSQGRSSPRRSKAKPPSRSFRARRSSIEAKEVVTTYKLKNMSSAPIAMLKVDEYWYEKGGKMVSTDTQRHKQPFLPGEVIEMTTHAPRPGVTGRRRKTPPSRTPTARSSVKPVKAF